MIIKNMSNVKSFNVNGNNALLNAYDVGVEVDETSANLNIGDDNGNVIVQFKNGHINTQNFDSEYTSTLKYDNSTSNFNIGDDNGNVIVQFKNGHIKTQNFNSEYIDAVDLSSKCITTTLSSFTEGSMSIDNPNCKNHYMIWFYANINVMGTLKIRLGTNNQWSSGILDITSTDIVEYAFSTYETTTTSHGLNMIDNIIVCIRTTCIQNAHLTIITGDGDDATVFTKEISWSGCSDGCTITNTGGDYANCEFSLSIDGLLKKVWVFGDSYTDFWPIQLENLGVTDFNFYIDAFSARTSSQALTSFYKDLNLSKPRAIIWMMGMNDPDNDSINSSWKTSFDSLYASCKFNDIELYCCTIPCTPSRNNAYKNAYIINSGCKIIDVAAEVGASDSGSSWYAGLLKSDNVHPTPSGALRIALLLFKNITYIQNFQ